LQPALDLQTHIEKKAEGLAKHRCNVQPHVVILGDLKDIDNTVSYAVLHSTVYYEAASFMDAVDICMKAMFVFGLDFPAAAHSTWSFVQRGVYGLATKYDRVPSKVLELMSDVQ